MSSYYHAFHRRAISEFEAKIPDEFRRLLQTDPVVNSHFQQWMHGGFDSFEKMLLTLVVHLATQNKQLFNSFVAMKFHHPGKFGLIETFVLLTSVLGGSILSSFSWGLSRPTSGRRKVECKPVNGKRTASPCAGLFRFPKDPTPHENRVALYFDIHKSLFSRSRNK